MTIDELKRLATEEQIGADSVTTRQLIERVEALSDRLFRIGQIALHASMYDSDPIVQEDLGNIDAFVCDGLRRFGTEVPLR